MFGKYKRIFLFVAVVALVFSLFVVAVACDEKGETNVKKATGIEVTVAASSALTYTNGNIVVKEGAVPTFAAADFSVQIVYSDGSKEGVTGFTIDASGVASDAPAGYYFVTISYQGFSYSVQVVVEEAPKTALPAIDTGNDFTYEYTGEEIDILAKFDLGREENEKLIPLLNEGKISVSTAENLDMRKAKDAGGYVLCLVAADGYVWVEDGVKYSEKTIYWYITKKVVPKPTIVGETSFVYTGEEITLSVDTHGFDDVVTFVNGSATNKGVWANQGNDTYHCSAVIKEECQANYSFADAQVAVDVGDWRITPRFLDIPVLLEYTSKETDESEVDWYHYPNVGGEVPDVKTSVDDDPLFSVDVSVYGENRYIVSIEPAFAGELRPNYRWNDGTETGAEIIGGFTYNVELD